MKFINFPLIVSLSKNNPPTVLELFKHIVQGNILKIPKKYINASKDSFILNPNDLIEDRITDILFKYQYLDLVSRRDYTLYKLYGIKYLPLSYFPELNIDHIKYNPLLTINNQHIYFKYEEISNGN